MAIYKPTDCVPSGQSFDALNNRPIFVECKIDTNNAIVNGYSLEFFDVENNRIFPEDSADIHDINHITLVSDLRAFFDARFSAYGKGYTDLNTGINGSYLKIPILFNEVMPSNTFANNVPVGILDNGGKYRWRITLYQELVASGSVTYPTDLKYYDMIIASGKVLGSTNERIQTALVADDEDLVSGLVLVDKYIQPVKISDLNYSPNSPKEWENLPPQGEVATIENTASRVLIENYDDIYGHIYPAKSGDNSFSQNDITPEVSNGFRIYKNGNNPENLGTTDKVYEIINYQVDENVYGWEYKTIISPLTYLGSSEATWPGSNYVYTNANGLIWANTQEDLSSYSIVSKQIVNGSVTIIPDNKINNVGIGANGKINFLIDNGDDVPEYRIYYGSSDRNNTRFYQNLSIQIKLRKPIIVNQWRWINTPASPSQSYWEQTYTTTTDPANGYYPFEQYSQSDINTMVFYGKERVIFNHMQTGGAYSGLESDRIYYGSCYNGIFTPEVSSKKVDGEDNKWDITIKWYRTTDANSWGQLLNKVVYVESGSTQTVEQTDGNVNLSPGSNAEITIGSTAGVINQTPFLFVLEKPIRLFSTTDSQTKRATILETTESSDNTYVISLEVGSENISSVDNITINSVTIPRNEYAAIINTTKIIYTPSGSPVTGDINVTYIPYKEQDYTGVIFYNIDVAGKKGYSYIKPFVGIDDRMVFNINGSNNYVHIEEINTKYWFVYYSLFSFSLANTDTPYQIRSCYRSGDLNEFGLYDDPRIPVKVYDSLGQEVELEDGKYAYYIPTRAFSVEIEYEQDDYILWESCQWDLYTAEKRLDKFIARDFVTTTSEKYDGRLRFVFYGLDDKQYYILKATIVTNSGGKFNQDIILYANYGEASTGHDRSTINFNYDDLCVEIYIKESSTNPDQIKDSIIRVYKREIWYYQDEIKRPDEHFRGQNSPWKLIGENALSGCIFKDYCVVSGHHYEYLICRDISVPEENDDPEQQTEHWITKEQWAQHLEIDVKYMGWSIVELHNPRKIDNGRITLYDAEAKDVWRFKYNVSSGSQTQNLSKTQQDTLGLYPHISVGEKNFMSGSVSCLLGREIIQADYRVDHYKYIPEGVVGPSEITEGYWTRNIDNGVYNAGGYKEELSRYLYPNYNNDYAPQYINADTLGFRNLTSNQAINMINAWKEIAYSGNNKLIRDEKGRLYIANILSNGINVNETWVDMPTEISFDWIEVDNTNQISVFENRATGEIVIDGDNDVDEDGYVPDMRYSGYSGSNKVWIKNPQNINGFGIDAFNGCINIMDIYIEYPELDPGETFDYEDLFDWWCTRDFKNSNSNPIHVSNGENGEGVRIFKQVSFNGKYELCSSIGSRDGEDFDENYRCLNAIPSMHSVDGYKYLQDVGIDLDGLGDDNSNGILPDGLFKGCTELTNAIIKNGNLGNDGAAGSGAFQDVESLQNVLMDNIVIIGPRSFSGCSNLISIEIPNTTTKIREEAFSSCVGLKELIVPGNVEYIYASAFYGCSQLSSLDLEDGILEISEKAFAWCYSLKNIVVPDSVSNIAKGAFFGCYGLEYITIPYVGGFAYIDEPLYQNPFGYIFGDEYYTNSTKVSQEYYWDEELVVSDYYIPSSLRGVVITNGEILYGAFSNCSMLTSIELPDNISTIGGKAFVGCSNLMSVEIPSSVVSIGSYAFYGSGLDTVYFENRANSLSIAFGAFAKCDISKVIYKGAVVNNNNVYINGWFEIDFEDPTSNPVANSGNLYYTINEENEEYELYNLYVPDRDINNYALYKCKSLQSIEFSTGANETTTTIGNYAFYDCSNVESINMSSAFIESIGEYAFYNMAYYFADSVESLILPRTIISVGESAFANLGSRIGFIDNQNKLYINSCPDIGKNAFYNAQIGSVYYREDTLGSVEGWLDISFDNLYANPLYQFGADLYFYDPNQTGYIEIREIEFPEGISNIPKYAFAGSKLDIITFEDDNVGVSVGDYAFYNCFRLQGDSYDGENLPSTITSVGKYSFAGTRISNISNSLTSVDEGSFANSFVSKVHISNFISESLPAKLFDGCSMLSILELSRNTTSTGSNALRGCNSIGTLWANVDIINSFDYKMNLTEIKIYLNAPDLYSQQSIPDEMLTNSTALESVTIVGEDSYSNGHSIGKYAFANCSNLSELVLSDSHVRIIEEGAFGGSIISSVTIPDYMWKIEPEAFHTNRGNDASFPASTWKLSKDGYSDVSRTITYNGGTQNPSEVEMAADLMGVDGDKFYTDRTWERQN